MQESEIAPQDQDQAHVQEASGSCTPTLSRSTNASASNFYGATHSPPLSPLTTLEMYPTNEADRVSGIELSFCSYFECCNLQLPDFHAFVDHCEEEHISRRAGTYYNAVGRPKKPKPVSRSSSTPSTPAPLSPTSLASASESPSPTTPTSPTFTFPPTQTQNQNQKLAYTPFNPALPLDLDTVYPELRDDAMRLSFDYDYDFGYEWYTRGSGVGAVVGTGVGGGTGMEMGRGGSPIESATSSEGSDDEFWDSSVGAASPLADVGSPHLLDTSSPSLGYASSPPSPTQPTHHRHSSSYSSSSSSPSQSRHSSPSSHHAHSTHKRHKHPHSLKCSLKSSPLKALKFNKIPSAVKRVETVPIAPALAAPGSGVGLGIGFAASVKKSSSASASTSSATSKSRRERAFRCPNVGCTKTYLNPNGLKYHLEKGTCKIEGFITSPRSSSSSSSASSPTATTAASAFPGDFDVDVDVDSPTSPVLPSAAGAAFPLGLGSPQPQPQPQPQLKLKIHPAMGAEHVGALGFDRLSVAMDV